MDLGSPSESVKSMEEHDLRNLRALMRDAARAGLLRDDYAPRLSSSEWDSAWQACVRRPARFPFDAAVGEPIMDTSLEVGDEVSVHKVLTTDDDRYGIIVEVSRAGLHHSYPLCALKPTSKRNSAELVLDDYIAWFAYRW